MAIICDCCKKDVTPTEEEEFPEREVLSLRDKKICLCNDCLITLSEFACSEEHKQKTKEYLKELK